ncbi:MAG: sensor histidine kinase [Flavobacteriales bacterium]|nr:sensor histidine kinase [Flavobacteriales bacterium]
MTTRILLFLLFLSPSGGTLIASDGDFNSKDLLGVQHLLPEGSLKQLDALPEDSTKVDFLVDLAYALEYPSPDSAIWLYDQALVLAEKVNYQIAKGRCMLYAGIVNSDQGNYDEAFKRYAESSMHFEKIGYSTGVAAAATNEGVIYNYLGQFDKAASKYMIAIEVYEKDDDKQRLSYALGNYASVLMELGQQDQALIYFNRVYDLSMEVGSESDISSALLNVGHAYAVIEGKIDSAFVAYYEAERLAISSGNYNVLYLSNNNLAQAFFFAGKGDSAMFRARKTLNYAELTGNPYNVVNAKQNLGCRELEFGSLDAAEVLLKSAYEQSVEMNMLEQANNALECLAETMAGLGKYEEAYEYKFLHLTYRDSVLNTEKTRQINDLEVKYQSAIKDREIAETRLDLASEAQGKRQAWIGIGILFLVVIFLVISYTQRKKLHERKVANLRNEQQIASYKSMILGEEKERIRIAKDLHDGLSGMLAALKMRMSKAESHEGLIASMDEVSGEVRRISHNLMPGSLERYGLIDALNSWITDINSAKQLEVSFEHMGMEQRFEPHLERMVYRIVMELVNNIIKHAQAKETMVQLVRRENLLTITIEDDGRGFDTSKEYEGLGMKSIRSRVDAINGEIDIQSQEGRGTSVYIEIQL